MNVPQPFEKDTLTEEEIVSLATMNGRYPLEKRMDYYWDIKEYLRIYGSVKGKTLDMIIDDMN